MTRMQFATDVLDPHTRLVAGIIGVAGLGASMLVGAMVLGVAVDYLGAPFVALVLGIWIATSVYVKAWNRWSPWAPNGAKSEVSEDG